MKNKYTCAFDRLHSLTHEKQVHVVTVETEIPFDDEHLEEFIDLFWAKLHEEQPLWGSGRPLINGRGWTSAGMVDGRITLVREENDD